MEREDSQEDYFSPIRVYIRVKPSKSTRKAVQINNSQSLTLVPKSSQYEFDHIFGPGTKQAEFFDICCRPIVDHLLEGFNGCLFAYGQTGSGKTYSMGMLDRIESREQGLVSMALDYLFAKAPERSQVCLSFMQIYMEEVHDLLDPDSGKLTVREDQDSSEVFVDNLTTVRIQSYEQGVQLVNAGLNYRKVGNQKMNQLSSRSHTILTIYFTHLLEGALARHSSLALIDLAGSERLKRSNSTGLRLEETKFINTSLSALGSVIASLSENRT
jgi:hypothetical protein